MSNPVVKELRDGATIGRFENCDLVLNDRSASRKHACIHKTHRGYQLEDTSSPGTIINGTTELTSGQRYMLNQGDRIEMGAYELQVVEIAASTSEPSPSQTHDTPPPKTETPHIETPHTETEKPFDINSLFEEDFQDKSQAQSAGTSGDSGRAKHAYEQPDPSAGANSGSSPFTMDYFFGEQEKPDETFTDAAQEVRMPNTSATTPDQAWTPDHTEANTTETSNNGHDPASPNPGAFNPGVNNAGSPRASGTDYTASSSKAHQQANQAFYSAAQEDKKAISAFLKALGVEPNEIVTSDRTEIMRTAGEMLHTLTQNMMNLLKIRESNKSQMRMERTQMMATIKNPLKVASTPEKALELMLTKKAGYLDAQKASDEAVEDTNAHQMAMLQSMHQLLLRKIEDLSPPKIESETDMGFPLPGVRNLKYWETYKHKYEQLKLNSDLNEDDMITDELIELYQQALAKLT